jgi:hypothetical protein
VNAPRILDEIFLRLLYEEQHCLGMHGGDGKGPWNFSCEAWRVQMGDQGADGRLREQGVRVRSGNKWLKIGAGRGRGNK